MSEVLEKSIIDEDEISSLLANSRKVDPLRIREILSTASLAKGLAPEDVAQLMCIEDTTLENELFETAKRVKEAIYGKRLVLFAPLYVSNLCANECLYCAFRARNKEINRRALSSDEIAREVEALVDQGHKRVLLVAGESYPKQGFGFVLEAIKTVYGVKSERGEIRRVNVNVAPLRVDEFRQLAELKIGTYQLFQETYHRETYSRVHLGGKKRDYDWRLSALDRAMEAGIDDVGIGVLFGLHSWKFEILALLQHIGHLDERFGVGPHTISVPRLEPATGSELAAHPPHPVSDDDFRKIVAILRLAVPYTGIIMSTRETAHIRREGFALGVSQISAGSRTNPGGYSREDQAESGQFSLGDHRPLDEVVRDIASLGYLPSFCTGCYRLGRTGSDFMDLAKPGEIKTHCDPNAVSSFLEYLQDYGSDETRLVGLALIERVVEEMEGVARRRAEKLLAQVRAGKRDVFC